MPAPKDPVKRAQWIENIRAAMIGKKQSPEQIAATKAAMNRPEVRAKNSAAQRRYFSDPINRLKTSKATQEAMNRPEVMLKLIAAMNRPEVRDKLRKSAKERWTKSEYARKIIRSSQICPNKSEQLLETLLNTLLPDEFKYVGGGDFELAGKYPDFVNVNGKKQIIELFGDYWHKDENPQDRINLFAQYGFETLVIWCSELRNSHQVEDKILGFTGYMQPALGA